MSAEFITIFSIAVFIGSVLLGVVLAFTRPGLDKNIKLCSRRLYENDIGFDMLCEEELILMNEARNVDIFPYDFKNIF